VAASRRLFPLSRSPQLGSKKPRLVGCASAALMGAGFMVNGVFSLVGIVAPEVRMLN
jgi:hypothetical protein